jgi:hypothetical protein
VKPNMTGRIGLYYVWYRNGTLELLFTVIGGEVGLHSLAIFVVTYDIPLEGTISHDDRGRLSLCAVFVSLGDLRTCMSLL